MKKLLVVMIVLACATSVFAQAKKVEVKAEPKAEAKAETALKVSGDMYVGGNRLENTALVKSSKASNSYFDYDLNLNAQLIANENASVFLKLTYDKDVKGVAKVAKQEQANGVSAGDVTDALAVERAYFSYKINPMIKFDAGLMGGGTWGTKFGDTESNEMRLKGTFNVAEGMTLLAIYQKNYEQADAPAPAMNSEKNDFNTYYLAGIFNFAPIKVMPLFAYASKGSGYGDGASANDGNSTTMAMHLAVTGDFGMAGFESEFIYSADKGKKALKPVSPDKDDTKMGAYINVFAKVDPAKVGFAVAYASDKSDKQQGAFAWGKDFDFTIAMDDWIGSGNSGCLVGWTVAKLYAEAAFGQASAGLAVAYGMDNVKEGKATFTEIDVTAGYEFDATTSYSMNIGYAMTNKWKGTEDKANALVIYHGMTVKF